jgi:adenosylcobyric acid synthase
MRAALAANRGWQHGQTLALYPHGLFESSEVMRALFGRAAPTLEDTLNGLADFVDAHFARSTLLRLIEQPPP